MSRLPREPIAMLAIGVEVTDSEPNGCKCSALPSSGALGGRFSWESGGGAGSRASSMKNKPAGPSVFENMFSTTLTSRSGPAGSKIY